MPCAHYPETEAKIMPDPEFTLAPGASSWMQAFAWDPLEDEIFMTQNIRTSKRSADYQDQQARQG